jgi:hypothetical protein
MRRSVLMDKIDSSSTWPRLASGLGCLFKISFAPIFIQAQTLDLLLSLLYDIMSSNIFSVAFSLSQPEKESCLKNASSWLFGLSKNAMKCHNISGQTAIVTSASSGLERALSTCS